MKRIFKISAIAFLLLLVLTAAAAVALWYYLPREQVRDLITRELSSRLRQTITMSGFSLGLYPDIEFIAKDVRILDPPSLQEIAAAEKIRFHLNTRQLLNRRFIIETVTAGSPRVTVSRNAAGTWNIADIVRNAGAGTASADQAQPAAGLHYKEIKIRNGSISINDELLNQHINLTNLAGTINLKEATATIDSASLKMPSLEAELSGSIIRLFTSDPIPDITAKVQLRKEGPLADIISEKLPAGSKIADMTVNASGSTKALMLKTSFSIEPLATAGLSTRGTVTGTLQAEQGLCTIDALDLRCGKNTLSLSGRLNNLWHKERSALLQGTTSLSLDETVPLAESSTLSNLGLRGLADARINLAASSGQANLTGTIDLSKAAFSLPNLMNKEAGSPASLLFDARFTAPEELVINNFELVIGENRITGTAKVDPGTEPRLQTSLRTAPLSLSIFNQLPAVLLEGGVMTLSAQAWQTGKAQEELQYRAQALLQDGNLAWKIMNAPFDRVSATIEAVNNLAVIPDATFFLAETPYQLSAEVRDFTDPQITGQIYTNTLDIDTLIKAFRKPEKSPQEPPPEPAATSPGFSLDMAVDTESLCFGKLRTGAVSTTWHTSGRLQRFEPLYADLFGGRLEGTLYLSFHKGDNRWYAAFTGEEMDIESLCDQFFRGQTAASAKGLLRAEGNLNGISSSKKHEVWESMQGNLELSVERGEISQSPLFNSILLALKVSQGFISLPGISDLNLVTMLHDVAKSVVRTLDVSRMVFKTIEGSFRVSDGIARTEDLYFVGDTADFVFRGAFDLVRQEMDITIHVIPTGTLDSLVSKIPLLGRHIDRIKRATLSFNLVARGPFAKPDVQLQAVDKILP